MSLPVFYFVVFDYKFNKVLLKIIYFSSVTLLVVFLLSYGHAVLKCKVWKLLQLVNGVTGCRTGAWFLKDNMQVVCTVLCICMISTGCSYDQDIFRLTLKLHFSTKKCVHAFMLFS